MKQLTIIGVGGLLFGFGLAWSGLVRQEVVLTFLRFEDLGLALMMASAIAISMPVYQLVPRMLARPPAGERFERFPGSVTRRNVIGAVVFGVGWGVSGVCPGAVLGSLGVGNWPVLTALAGLLVGAFIQGAFLAERPTRAVQASP